MSYSEDLKDTTTDSFNEKPLSNTTSILNKREKDFREYTKEELTSLIESTSVLKIYKTKESLKNLYDLYVYLCKLADEDSTTYSYRGITYKILEKTFLEETFKDLNTLFELFKLKMPVISETDPLVLYSMKQKSTNKSKATLDLQKGSFYCIYRDYEKNTPSYIYFRVLK